MSVDLATLRALAEAANRPEPPNTYQGPDGLSWALSRETWKTAQRNYLAAVEAMGPAGLLRLLAVVEAAEAWEHQRGVAESCSDITIRRSDPGDDPWDRVKRAEVAMRAASLGIEIVEVQDAG